MLLIDTKSSYGGVCTYNINTSPLHVNIAVPFKSINTGDLTDYNKEPCHQMAARNCSSEGTQVLIVKPDRMHVLLGKRSFSTLVD